MAMETIFETFFNVATIVMCLGIFLFTYVIRRVVETMWEGAKKNKYWNEIFLPVGAIAIGAIIALIAKKFPLPVELSPSTAGRLMYGAVCGLFSTFIYNRVRAWIKVSGVTPSPDDPIAQVTPVPALVPEKKDEPSAPVK